MITPSRYINPEEEGQMSDMDSSRPDRLHKHINHKQIVSILYIKTHITNELCELHHDTIPLTSSYCFTIIVAVHVII